MIKTIYPKLFYKLSSSQLCIVEGKFYNIKFLSQISTRCSDKHIIIDYTISNSTELYIRLGTVKS